MMLPEFLEEYENLDIDREDAKRVWNAAIDATVKEITSNSFITDNAYDAIEELKV